MRARSTAGRVAIGVAVVVVLLVGTVVLLTRTDWGRERVRSVALERLAEQVNGEVEIGRIEGDLLRGFRLIDVAIRDQQSRPFLEADTIETRFGLRSLLRKRIELSGLRVVGAGILLDQPPGEEWNYVRIFGGDDDGTSPGPSGWGDWVTLEDVTLVDSRVTVRSEWEPPEDATAAEREKALREALAGDSRERVIEVPGGYQTVMDFRDLNAEFPSALLAHPDSVGSSIDVARLSGLIRPFSAPPARIHDLSGEVHLLHDSLFLSGIRAVLPGSRLSGGAIYALHSGELLMLARGAPVAFEDLRWLEPSLPEQGGGELMMRLELGSLADRVVAWDMDIGVGEARVHGRFDLTTGDTVRFGPTDLRFARVETGLIERLFEVDIPRSGRLTGELALRGPPRALQVGADVRFDDRAGPTSRILAEGELGIEPELRFDRLRLRFSPLHAELARLVAPELPLRGTIEGTALLTGALQALELEADLALRDPRHGLSQLRLAGGVDRRDELRLRDMVVRMDPLRLDLLRDELPDLPAGATVTGRVVLDGTPARALSLDGDIVLDDPATGVSGIAATGEVVFADELRLRDLRLRFSPLQAELARVAFPELPVRGSIEGSALLTGTLSVLELEADLTLRDPRHGVSRIIAAGGVDRRDELRLRNMDLRMNPLRLELLRGELPELPAGAAVTGRVTLHGAPGGMLRLIGDVAVDDPATGVSDIELRGGVALRDGTRFEDLRLRMHPLQVDLVRPWLPEELPRGGTLAGDLLLNGSPDGFLHVDGSLSHRHARLGVSSFQVRGGIDAAGPLEFRGFDVRMEPLHMALVRPFVPDLPLRGTLRGTATLDGSPSSRIAVRGDVVHQEPGERSRVVGEAEVLRGRGGWASVDVRLEPLSLDVAGRFVPAAGLHGSVTGRFRASGTMGDLRVDADLAVAGGGDIRAEGSMDLAAEEPVYDLDMRLSDFDLAALTWKAPAQTDLTGTVRARGQGLEPTTMRATIAADLASSGIDGAGADRVRLRARLESGLAHMDSSLIRLDGAEALLDGSFGLVAGRDGVLTYRVAVDSLHAFAAWLPGADTAVGRPAPLDTPTPEGSVVAAAPEPAEVQAPEVDLAGSPAPVTRRYTTSDGARVTVNTTRVQSGIARPEREPTRVGPDVLRLAQTPERQTPDAPRPAPPGTPDPAGTPDTTGTAEPVDPSTGRRPAGDPAADMAAEAAVEPAGSPRSRLPVRASADSLAGSLTAAGTLRGNVTRFDLDGRAVVDELVYGGAYVGAGEAEYTVKGAATPSPDVTFDAELRDVRTATIAFDSLSAEGRYHGFRGEGTGEAVIVAHGTDDTEYRADAEFALSLDRSELRLADLVLRYDTVTWRTTEPAVVSWAGDAIELADVEVVSNAGGRVRLDGRLPVDGSGDMDVLVEDLDLATVVALLQLDQDSEGRLHLDANVGGTLGSPRIVGTARIDDARLNGEEVPDVRAEIRYQGKELTADAALLHDGRQLATVEARLPIRLSLLPGTPPRLLPGELAIDLQADSLPIEAIPGLSEQIRDQRGRLRGDIAVRGSFEDPVITGDIDLDLGSVLLVPLGIRLERVAGALRMEGDVVHVDSLVAYSGGPLRVTGEIGIGTLTDPSFDLEVVSSETLVLDTDDISLEVDARLTVGGTLSVLDVGGQVRTRRGVIQIPELTELGATDVVSLHSPATSGRIEEEFLQDQLRLSREQPLLDRVRLDVTLQVDRDVWLRSTEANVEIYTPRDQGPLHIRLGGAGSRVSLEGTLSTDRGEYEFMSRRFDLTRGAATFVGEGEINPILQIAAEHQVRLPGREAFAIRVLLGGTLRDMEITLESSAQPPIAQTDLLSYLAFGREANSLLYQQGSSLSAQGGEAGDLVGNVAGLATQQLGTIALDAVVGDIERELMEEFGVDVFRITPADLPPDMFTGGYGDLLRSTEIEAGRYFTSRMFIAGQVNTGMSRPGVRLEYVGPFGVRWQTSYSQRWMPTEPTLTDRDPRRAGILGSFLMKEWRF